MAQLLPKVIIENGRLYLKCEKHGRRREVTHISRLDGGGQDYLELRVSDDKVGAYFHYRDGAEAIFTLRISSEGDLVGDVPGGYDYALVVSDRR